MPGYLSPDACPFSGRRLAVATLLILVSLALPASAAPPRDTTEALLTVTRASLAFRAAARTGHEAALARFADDGARRAFRRFDAELWLRVAPARGWAFFFETSLVCLGAPNGSGQWVVGYYHPWSEVMLLSVWKVTRSGGARLVDAEVVTGDFMANFGEPPYCATRFWQTGGKFVPPMVAVSGAMQLQLFETAFRTFAPRVTRWDDVLPPLRDEKRMEAVRLVAALRLLDNMREVVDATAAVPQDAPSRAYRAAFGDFRSAARRGTAADLMGEGVEIDPDTLGALQAAGPETWRDFRIVSYLPGPATCMALLGRAEYPDQFLALLYRMRTDEARLARVDLLSFQAFHGILEAKRKERKR